MLREILCTPLILGLCFHVSAVGAQKTAAPPAKSAGEKQAKEDPFGRFRWLAGSSDSQGMFYETRKLASLKVDTQNLPSEVQTEVTRPNANAKRITRRVFDRGVNGETQLVEVIVEELRTTAGDGISATRTVSRRDVNGSLRVTRKETQEMVPAGPNAYRSQATVLVSRGSDTLTRAEEILQVEKKKSDGVVEIERTQRLPDTNGVWTTANRRVSSTQEANNEVLTREDVYRPDVNGKLSLAQKEVSREWSDPQGKVRRDSDIYRPSVAGSLDLSSRSSIVRVTYADGSEQTTQTLLQKNTASPSEGLRLTEKIVETARPAAANSIERNLEVQVPDVNGKLQLLGSRRILEKK